MDPYLSVFKPDLHHVEYPDLIEKLDQRMKPGACSQVGFLAEDEKLLDVCQKDSLLLKSKNITHEQIADRLEAVLLKAEFLLRQSSLRNENFLMSLKRVAVIEETLEIPCYVSSHGEQQCPFSHDLSNPNTWCGKGTSSIKIINTVSGKCLKNITKLHVHLIRDHHYFEGNTEYRIDPELAIEVLNIKPEFNYQLKLLSEQSWNPIAYMGRFSQADLWAARENKIESFEHDSQAFEAYLLPYEDYNSYKYRGLTRRQKIEQEGFQNNKSREQIDQDIAQFIKFEKMLNISDSRLDQPMWKSKGKDYLHVFTFRKLHENDTFSIGKAMLTSLDIRPPTELTVYESIKRVIPILDTGDYVK